MSATRWATYRPSARPGPRPEDLVVRPAGSGDCEAIASIESDRDGVAVGLARRRCEEQTTDPETLLVVARVGGRVVGFGRAGYITQPSEAPEDAIPDGWYLLGLVVVDAWRRRGIGRVLTDYRLRWIGRRAEEAFYYANARNLASLDLHRSMGFDEVTRQFSGHGIVFDGGEGVLCRFDGLSRFDRKDPPT